MRHAIAPLLLVSLLVSLLATGASAQEASDTDAAAVDAAVRKAVEGLKPFVVEVEALGGLPERFRAPKNEGAAKRGVLAKKGFKQAYGPTTGLIVQADGVIATSTFAVSRKPRHLIVTLADGRSFVAKVLGEDASRGIVLLKIDAQGLPVPRFTPRAELKVGRYTIALGRGLGTKEPAVALGIVSAVGRIGGRAIQSSALISPVNYGGPLGAIDGSVMGLLVPLDMTGGMASVDIYDSGIGFAIPGEDLLSLVPRLVDGKELKAGFLGVVPDPTHTGGGVRVADVADGSPSKKAGLKEGDVIVSLGGVATDAVWQLRRALAKHYAGDTVKLKVSWQGDLREVAIELAEPPKAPVPGHDEMGLEEPDPEKPPGTPPE